MYGKIFSEIFDSSIVQYEGDTIYVFMCLIVLADRDGYVRLNPIALANRIRKPIEVVQEALKNLEKPDPYSSNPEYEGRRIIPLSELTGGEENRGWWVVSYRKWRDIASEYDRREKTRERIKKWRNVKKTLCDADVTQCNADVTQCNADVTLNSDTDTDIDTDIDIKTVCSIVGLPANPPDSKNNEYQKKKGEIIEKWNKFAQENTLPLVTDIKSGSIREKHLKARLREGFDIDETLRAIREQPFLLGQNQNGWTITFDWIIRPSNWTKIMERNYIKQKKLSSIEILRKKYAEEGKK